MSQQPSGETTSASLLVRVRDPSDDLSWREFEGRYAELIRRYCRGRGLAAPDIDDVSQVVWSELARNLRNFAYDPSRGRFRAYLGKTVRSAIARHFARYGKRVQALDTVVLASTANGTDAADEAWEKEWVDHHYRVAMETIERTFDGKSVALFRGLLAGESAQRLASDYGMTPAAVNQAKHRIRTRMRELIAAQIREEDDPDSYGGA